MRGCGREIVAEESRSFLHRITTLILLVRSLFAGGWSFGLLTGRNNNDQNPRNNSPSPLDVPPGENRIAANAELHPVFDFFVHRHRFFPIDFGILAEHDCSDERICAVG